MIINPGTGPVEGANETEAAANIETFVKDLGLSGIEYRRSEVERKQDRNGRFVFTLRSGKYSVEVDMPGTLRVRGQSQFDFPRLYVNGSSWFWDFAVGIARSKLEGEE